MTGALDLGHGLSSTTRPDRQGVQRHLGEVWSRLFSKQAFDLESRINRGMGRGPDQSEAMDGHCVGVARDVFGVMTDDEFARLMARVQRRKEAA